MTQNHVFLRQIIQFPIKLQQEAIFYHQSQKDGVMFKGDDHREFWVRAEERNANTAMQYRAVGLADYAAMEAFKRHFF